MIRAWSPSRPLPAAAPWVAALVALGVFAWWLSAPVRVSLVARVPGTDRLAGDLAPTAGGDAFAGRSLVTGSGKPADLPGSWPRFRGARIDGIASESTPLARSWPATGPRQLWTVEVGEGYAGPVVDRGRVYLMDYDREKQRDALRCLSLADGAEIWRLSYPLSVKRNHGLTRTVPTLAGDLVVAMGPKCHVLCAEAASGKFQWGIDLVKDWGTTIPPWYTGQCPLVDGDALILAPGGPEALLLAVDLKTGQERWRTPNPSGWKMTHSSVVPLEVSGKRYYLYCASGGVVAASATDGAIAWETSSWKINIATVPTPVLLDDGRVFFTGGYNAGSLLLRFAEEGGRLTGTEVFRVKASVFGATQHSPIWWKGNLYGIRADGRVVCLSPEGRVVWASGPETQFGLGPLMLAGDLLFALNDDGRLTLIEANPTAYQPLAEARIMEGHECWAPFALAGDRLLVRDLTRMVCLSVGR